MGRSLPGQNQIHTRVSAGTRGIDLRNARMRMWRTEEFAMGHSGQGNVVGEAGLARYFCASVNSSPGNADYTQGFRVCR